MCKFKSAIFHVLLPTHKRLIFAGFWWPKQYPKATFARMIRTIFARYFKRSALLLDLHHSRSTISLFLPSDGLLLI